MAGRGGSAARYARVVLAVAAALTACEAAPPLPPDPPSVVPAPPASDVQTPVDSGDVPPSFPRPCADLYDDGLLPTFEVTLSAADWLALQQDLVQGEEVWYPATFRLGDEVVPDAAVRLRGNNSRCAGKLQLAIGFNQLHSDGRFHGLRRLNLDHGGCNLLEERLALSVARDVGLPASCANHARLVVNGAYQGVFLNVEHVNKDFLRRSFGSAFDDGNLYKSGWELHTNEEENDTRDLTAYRAAAGAAELAALADLDEAVLEWALEAVLPARDNYWLHGWNYYLYHHPERGFLFVPADLDRAFPDTSSEVELATLLPDALQRAASLALADPAWRARYAEAVRRVADAYDPGALSERLDRWWAQVAAAVREEPVPTYTGAHVSALEARIAARAAWLDTELAGAGW